MRVTRNTLDGLVTRLNLALCRPPIEWTYNDKTGTFIRSNDGHLKLTRNSPGDGWTRYQLCEVSGERGGLHTISPTYNAQEILAYLRGVWDVLDNRLPARNGGAE